MPRNLIVAVCAISVVAGSTVFTGCSATRTHRSTGRAIDDTSLTARVKTDLLTDPVMKGSSVSVKTYNGQVQLNGWVVTPEQKQQAEKIARNVSGVAGIQNNLALKEASGAATP